MGRGEQMYVVGPCTNRTCEGTGLWELLLRKGTPRNTSDSLTGCGSWICLLGTGNGFIIIVMLESTPHQLLRPRRFQPFEEVVLLNDRCEVCYSTTDFEFKSESPTDRLVKCTMCLSSIHQTHYGGNLATIVPEEWFCERCEYLLNNEEGVTSVSCHFCPSKQGIMKIIDIDKEKVWSHLECITWDYPLRVFTTTDLLGAKRFFKPQTPFQKFWCPQFANRVCKHCGSGYGQFIRCRYYNCGVHFHVPCARKIGVIRELERMRVENTDTYVPVLCKEHLERRGPDMRAKMEQFHDRERSREAGNLAKIYEKQYADLLKAAKEEAKAPQSKFIYEELLEELVEESPSEATPMGEVSVYSQAFLNRMEEEMKDFDFDI